MRLMADNTTETYLRSINIAYDADSTGGIQHFHPTAKSVELINSLIGPTREHAVFVVAPYGSGKSLAAAFALHLVENRESSLEALTQILVRLAKVSPELAAASRQRVQNRSTKGLVLTIQGQVKSIPEAIQQAAIAGLNRLGLVRQAKVLAALECGSTAQITAFLNEAANHFQAVKIDQVLIIWDEFGRHLEDLIATGRVSELHDLQVLAEYCARTHVPPFSLAVLMHQGLLRYATRLSQTARSEWTKIEGRFRTLQYVDTSKQIYSLIGEIVSHRQAKDTTPNNLAQIARAVKAEGLFHDFKDEELAQLLSLAYPLEPLTLHLLPRISARVAQNERTLFSFLHECDITSPVTPADLYDYFGPQMHADVSVGGTNKQWLQTESAITKCSTHPESVKVLKTACLLGLGLSGERAHATLGLLKLAAAGYAKVDQGAGIIRDLISKNLLLHRKHTDSISVWHGTDYDLRGRLEEDKARRGADFDLLAFLRSQAAAPNWKPSRYNAQAEIRRYFKGCYVTPRQLQSDALTQMQDGEKIFDGRIAYVVAEDNEGLNLARSYAKAQSHEQLVLAIAPDPLPIREAALEVQCLIDMQHDIALLSQDPIVPVELEQMLDDARTHLQRLLDRATRPDDAGPVWWHRGKPVRGINTPAELREELSTIMASIFDKTPVLRNELVNRQSVSRPIINARKKLMMGILDQIGQDNLGFLESEDHTPQASMYRTLLVNTGLYVRPATSGGKWRFAVPARLQDPGLRAVWSDLEEFFTAPNDGKTFDEAIALLKKPPYGVRSGIIPILLCAAFKAFPAATVLLKCGQYMSDLVSSDFEDICAYTIRFPACSAQTGQ